MVSGGARASGTGVLGFTLKVKLVKTRGSDQWMVLVKDTFPRYDAIDLDMSLGMSSREDREHSYQDWLSMRRLHSDGLPRPSLTLQSSIVVDDNRLPLGRRNGNCSIDTPHLMVDPPFQGQ